MLHPNESFNFRPNTNGSTSNVDECKETVDAKLANLDALNLDPVSNENCKLKSFDFTSVHEVWITNLELAETSKR